jgi:acyl dehydratase
MDLDALGAWVDEAPVQVKREWVVRYAGVIGDREELHAEGEVAPPVFSALLVHDSVKEALRRFIGSELAKQCLHGEHMVRTEAPLKGGETAWGRASAVSAWPTRAGTVILITAEVFSGQGVVAEHSFTNILPGKQLLGSAVGTAAMPASSSSPRPAELTAEVKTWVPENITYRYADVSGDHHRYHTDPAAARAAGFETVIAHGLCTLALAGTVLTERLCDHHAGRLASIGARFAAPLLPGQHATTRLWPDGQDGTRWAFEMVDERQALVLKNGSATLRRDVVG